MRYPVGTRFVNPGDFEGEIIQVRGDECCIVWTDEAGREWYDESEVRCILEEYNRMYIVEPNQLPEDLFTI